MRTVHVLDSHTEGEPTRLVLSGGPDLGGGTVAEQRATFRERFDAFRSAVVAEPRGADALVGALLVPPSAPSCAAGVIFFNSVGYLGMCGHGAIGLVTSLAHLGRLGPGAVRLETAVGVVTAHLGGDGAVSVENVPAFRHARRVSVPVEGLGRVTGDVAWGGNWFFLVTSDHGRALTLADAGGLTDYAGRVRRALAAAGVTGRDRQEIDHIALYAPSPTPGVDSRGFVLCPGGAYDRSPCGTGTSARLACLHADGLLSAGQVWRQEGLLGGVFTGTIRREGDALIPTITGRAYVTAESNLLFDPEDPFREGLRA